MATLITAYSSFFIAFVFYFWLLYSRKKVEAALQKNYGPQRANILYVGLEKIAGFVLMLPLPYAILSIAGLYNSEKLGIAFTHPIKTLLWWGALGAVILVINFIRAGKPANYELYPQVRSEQWTLGLLVYYVAGWTFYLLGYEYLFRGMLFFAGIGIIPLWLNITINCILYAVAHLPKGKLEIIASLPFGIVLCLISYKTGSFWAAWLIHLTLALSNSLLALRAHPKMRLTLRKF